MESEKIKGADRKEKETSEMEMESRKIGVEREVRGYAWKAWQHRGSPTCAYQCTHRSCQGPSACHYTPVQGTTEGVRMGRA